MTTNGLENITFYIIEFFRRLSQQLLQQMKHSGRLGAVIQPNQTNPQTVKNNLTKSCVAYESLNAKIQVWSNRLH